MASFSSAFRSAWSRHAAKAGSGGVVALGMLATTMSDHQGQGQRRLAYAQAAAAAATSSTPSSIPDDSTTTTSPPSRVQPWDSTTTTTTSSPPLSSSASVQEKTGPEGINDESTPPAPSTTERTEATEIDYDSVEVESNPDCPLCRFMRASPCGGTWLTWEKCLAYHKGKEEDYVGPCSRFTLMLAECIQREKDSFPMGLRRALALEPEEEGEEQGEQGPADEEALRMKEIEAETAEPPLVKGEAEP